MSVFVVVYYACFICLVVSVATMYSIYYRWWGQKFDGKLFAADWVWIGGFVAQIGSFGVRMIARNLTEKKYDTWRLVEYWVGNVAFCWFMLLPAIRVARYYR